MRKHLAVAALLLLVIAVAGMLSSISHTKNPVRPGAWLHDEKNGVWYQEVGLSEAPTEGQAVRVKEKYSEQLMALPGLNGVGVGRHPFPNGNYVIGISFESQSQMDELMERGQIPPLLDGVRVVILDKPGIFKPMASAGLNFGLMVLCWSMTRYRGL